MIIWKFLLFPMMILFVPHFDGECRKWSSDCLELGSFGLSQTIFLANLFCGRSTAEVSFSLLILTLSLPLSFRFFYFQLLFFLDKEFCSNHEC